MVKLTNSRRKKIIKHIRAEQGKNRLLLSLMREHNIRIKKRFFSSVFGYYFVHIPTGEKIKASRKDNVLVHVSNIRAFMLDMKNEKRELRNGNR